MEQTATVVKKKNWFFNLILALFLLHSVPIIGWLTPTVVFFGIFLLLCVSTYNRIGGVLFQRFLIRAIPFSIVFYLSFLIQLNPFKNSLFVDVYAYLQIVILFIIGQYILHANDYDLAKKMAILLIFMYVITSITTSIACQTNPMVSRFLTTADASKDEEYSYFMSKNIGGFEFVYTLVLLLPLLIGCLKNNLGNRMVIGGIIILVVITIIETEFTTALLFSTISLALLVVPQKFNSSKSVIFLLIFGIVLVVGRFSLTPILSYIAKNTDSQIFAERFEDLGQIIEGNQNLSNTSDVGERSDLYQKSLHTFFHSPIIGSWEGTLVGGHSFMLDKFAVYGLLGVIGYILIWTTINKFILRPYRFCEWQGYFTIAFVEAIGLSILNPKVFYVFLCFIMPVFMVLFINKEKSQ